MYVIRNFGEIFEMLNSPFLKDKVENLYIIGGYTVYKVNQKKLFFFSFFLLYIHIFFLPEGGFEFTLSHQSFPNLYSSRIHL